MIQLATDPNASRLNWRPAPPEAKEAVPVPRKGRNGHAWPFISRAAERPSGPPAKPTPSGDHGS